MSFETQGMFDRAIYGQPSQRSPNQRRSNFQHQHTVIQPIVSLNSLWMFECRIGHRLKSNLPRPPNIGFGPLIQTFWCRSSRLASKVAFGISTSQIAKAKDFRLYIENSLPLDLCEIFQLCNGSLIAQNCLFCCFRSTRA